MNLKKALSKETICLALQATDKNSAIEEMVDLLVDSGKVRDRKAALKAILERERKMSTGMQNGIAIPHGKSETVDGLVAALGISKQGIDFDSLDDQPAYLFVATLSPVNRTGPHIQFLAEISRLLNSKEARDKVLHATSEEEILRVITG
jgi:PTS system nitrogen regulatory IIA component